MESASKIIARIEKLRRRIETEVAPSRELALALTKLDEAAMWLEKTLR